MGSEQLEQAEALRHRLRAAGAGRGPQPHAATQAVDPLAARL